MNSHVMLCLRVKASLISGDSDTFVSVPFCCSVHKFLRNFRIVTGTYIVCFSLFVHGHTHIGSFVGLSSCSVVHSLFA